MTPLFARIIFVLFFALSLAPLALAATQSGPNNTGTQSGPNNTQTQSGPNNTGTQLINPLNLGVDCTTNHTCISIFIQKMLQLVVDVGTVVVILMLVYVGFLFVKAQGEPGAISEARSALLWTVIGGLILLGAEGIAQAIAKTVAAITAAGS